MHSNKERVPVSKSVATVMRVSHSRLLISLSLSLRVSSEESVSFTLINKQKKQVEDVSLASGSPSRVFFTVNL